MGDLTEHFSRKEFECHCDNDCGHIAADIELLKILEKVRVHFGKPVHVHCVNRCPDHNASVGSKDTSQHIRGTAADFHINGVEPREISEYIDDIMVNSGGIGIYKNFVHLDIRKDKMARWIG